MTKELDTSKLEARLVASPSGLAELSEAVETALASIEGHATVELSTPDGEQFTCILFVELLMTPRLNKPQKLWLKSFLSQYPYYKVRRITEGLS